LATPINSPYTLPFAWYSDEDVLKRERTRIFARSWQYSGRAAQVAEPGALRVLKAYLRTNSRVRLAIARLVESIADQKPTVQKSVVQKSGIQKSGIQKSMTKASVARLDAATRGERRSSRART